MGKFSFLKSLFFYKDEKHPLLSEDFIQNFLSQCEDSELKKAIFQDITRRKKSIRKHGKLFFRNISKQTLPIVILKTRKIVNNVQKYGEKYLKYIIDYYNIAPEYSTDEEIYYLEKNFSVYYNRKEEKNKLKASEIEIKKLVSSISFPIYKNIDEIMLDVARKGANVKDCKSGELYMIMNYDDGTILEHVSVGMWCSRRTITQNERITIEYWVMNNLKCIITHNKNIVYSYFDRIEIVENNYVHVYKNKELVLSFNYSPGKEIQYTILYNYENGILSSEKILDSNEKWDSSEEYNNISKNDMIYYSWLKEETEMQLLKKLVDDDELYLKKIIHYYNYCYKILTTEEVRYLESDLINEGIYCIALNENKRLIMTIEEAKKLGYEILTPTKIDRKIKKYSN